MNLENLTTELLILAETAHPGQEVFLLVGDVQKTVEGAYVETHEDGTGSTLWLVVGD